MPTFNWHNILYLMSVPNEWQYFVPDEHSQWVASLWDLEEALGFSSSSTCNCFWNFRHSIYVDLFADFAPGDKTEHEEDDQEEGKHHFYEAAARLKRINLSLNDCSWPQAGDQIRSIGQNYLTCCERQLNSLFVTELANLNLPVGAKVIFVIFLSQPHFISCAGDRGQHSHSLFLEEAAETKNSEN